MRASRRARTSRRTRLGDWRLGEAPEVAAALDGGEPLLALGATGTGVIALTTRRLLVDDTPYEPEADTADGDRLLRDDRTLASGVAEQRTGRIAAALELVCAARNTPPPTPPPPAPEAAPDDALELLRRLGELRDRGVIDRAEFEAKKAELLDRI